MTALLFPFKKFVLSGVHLWISRAFMSIFESIVPKFSYAYKCSFSVAIQPGWASQKMVLVF